MTKEQIEAREQKVVSQIDGHFCYEWDGLAVSAWTYEYDACLCRKSWLGRIINHFVMWNFYRKDPYR